MNEITISISGPEGSGKTTLARQIGKVLKQCGVEYLLYDEGRLFEAGIYDSQMEKPVAGQDITMTYLNDRVRVKIQTEKTPA